MSFSGNVKAELCRAGLQRNCCAQAEAYGILLYANTFSATEIKIITGSEEFAQHLPRLWRKAFGFGFDIVPPEDNKGKFIYIINDSGKINAIFEKYGYEASSTLAHHINLGVLEDECCRTSFIRGAFLAGGSITDPEKRYHLELVTDHMNVSRETYSMLLEMGFEPHDTTRAGHYITYFKQSEAIEDFFTTIGAANAAMEIMEANYMNSEFGVQEFCDALGMSRTVASKHLNAEVGVPAGQFIRNYRLNMAKELLSAKTGNRNITEVAYKVGFNDPKYFTRCFTKMYGMNPSSYVGE